LLHLRQAANTTNELSSTPYCSRVICLLLLCLLPGARPAQHKTMRAAPTLTSVGSHVLVRLRCTCTSPAASPVCICICCCQARHFYGCKYSPSSQISQQLPISPVLLRLRCTCTSPAASPVPLHLLLSVRPAAAVRRAPQRQMLQQLLLQLHAPATTALAATPAGGQQKAVHTEL
jgi:hypothetical protein